LSRKERKESQKKSWQGNDEGGTSAEYSKRDPEQKEIMA